MELDSGSIICVPPPSYNPARCRGCNPQLENHCLQPYCWTQLCIFHSRSSRRDIWRTALSTLSRGTLHSGSSAVASLPLPRLFALPCLHFLLPGCLHLVLHDENLIKWKKRNPGVEIKRSSAPPLLQHSEPVEQHLCPTPEDKVRWRAGVMKPARVEPSLRALLSRRPRSLGFIIYMLHWKK